MTLSNTLRIAGFTLITFACAGIAAAQGAVTDSTSTSAHLEMSAEVKTALQLRISTGSGGATVTGNNTTGIFALDFGTVNGLGIGTPATGVTKSVDGSGATYTTPINLSPVYSGFTTETASVTVEAESGTNQSMAREGSSSGNVASVTTPATVVSGASSGSSHERFVGFRIDRTDAAGTKEATLVYTVTMNLD